MFSPEGVTHQPGPLWLAHLCVLGLCTGYRAFGGTALCTEHLQHTCGSGSNFSSSVPSSQLLAPFYWDAFEQGTVCSPGRHKSWQASAAPVALRADRNRPWLSQGGAWPSPAQATPQAPATHTLQLMPNRAPLLIKTCP